LVFRKTFNVCGDVDIDKEMGMAWIAGEKSAFHSLGKRKA
jgi:hypothetical protein